MDKKTLNIVKRAVRQSWNRSSEYKKILSKYATRTLNLHSNRLHTVYECQQCKQFYPRLETILEHLVPIYSLDTLTVEEYYNAMFDVSNVVPYCKPCAKAKTQRETKLRVQKKR